MCYSIVGNIPYKMAVSTADPITLSLHKIKIGSRKDFKTRTPMWNTKIGLNLNTGIKVSVTMV